MKQKMIFSIIVSAFYFISNKGYLAIRGMLEAEIAVNQVKDQDLPYFISNVVLSTNIDTYMLVTFLGILGIVWFPVIIKLIKNKKSN